MRALIIGGGIAGLALAAKLRQQGREPVVVEKLPEYGGHGYSLALYPFGSAVLHGIGAYDDLVEAGTELKTYELVDHRGDLIQSVDFKELFAEYGPTYYVTHADLVELLRRACGDDLDLRMGTTVKMLDQNATEVEATFEDGSRECFDVVAACDGINSPTREHVFGEQAKFETKWVGWTWWGRDGIFSPELVREHWLRGAFFGVYPVPGKSTYVAAVPVDVAAPGAGLDDATVLDRLRGVFGETLEQVPQIAAALDEAHDLWPWPLQDVRSEGLRSRRIVLCGDAGTAFLPLAGIGASSALRSAAALADLLSRADASLVPLATDLYVERTEKVVRGYQQDSRRLAKAMFLENGLATWGRDEVLRRLPETSVAKSVLDAMRQPI